MESDGLNFDNNIKGERIIDDAEYGGTRIHFHAKLGRADVLIQLDISFDDVVIPSETKIYYPTILDFPAPHLYGYSMESTIAEKTETMVKLDLLNSRLKDYFDLWLLSRRFNFDGLILAEAIKSTFNKRGTEIIAKPIGLTSVFSTDIEKNRQWKAFIKKNRLDYISDDFPMIVSSIANFIIPVLESIIAEGRFDFDWIASGPWKER